VKSINNVFGVLGDARDDYCFFAGVLFADTKVGALLLVN
jgi:hypothetical protein